jgi:hypothetical protein
MALNDFTAHGYRTCISLPGFHPVLQWGLIAHASGMIYGAGSHGPWSH